MEVRMRAVPRSIRAGGERRTRPAGAALDVPRPDASNPTGTRSGSHPRRGRNKVEDGTAVDRASMSVPLAVRVGKWI
jgi:hypothetical protein